MKNLKDFITESSIITEGKNECEVFDAGQVGTIDPKPQKIQISSDAKWVEISTNKVEYINFYNEDDLYEIENEDIDDNSKLFKNLKFGESAMTPDGNILIRIAK